jgi:hypothetical protein
MLFPVPHVAIMNYCVLELPTAEYIFVEPDPMSRTVTTTSRITTANMTAYFSHVLTFRCNHNLCVIRYEYAPLWLVNAQSAAMSSF